MRIISGERRGHKLHEFCGDNIRPTTDRVKESVFNLIQNYIQDSVVLDLFCGSGALSLEALSRGAERAVCVDIDKNSVGVIKRNVSELGYDRKCTVLNRDFNDYINNTSESFDIIFLDPPYNKGFIEPVLKSIAEKKLLKSDGIIVLESDGCDFHEETAGLSILKQRKYGRTFVTLYTTKESE